MIIKSWVKNSCGDSVFARYGYLAPGGLAALFIELEDNSNFHYTSGTDIQRYFSIGKWKIIKDTLILTSSLNRGEIPVELNEQVSGASDSLRIGLVKNRFGDVITGAVIFINNDTTKSCMPAFENECDFLKGSVDKIKISFNNNCSTKWYEIGKSVTELYPVLSVSFSLDNYIFFSNKKFLIREEGLYELREQIKRVKGKEFVSLVRDNSYFIKRQ